MNPVTQARAFIEADLDRDACREWLGELSEIQAALRTMYAPTGTVPMHSRPDRELNNLIMGVTALIARAELVGVVDDEYVTYVPAEFCTAPLEA